MITIWKVKLDLTVTQTVSVPKRHKLLNKVHWAYPDEIWVWMEVYLSDDPDHNELRHPELIEFVDKEFFIFGTGHLVYSGTKYLGSVVNEAQTNVWHVYTKAE